MFPLFLWLFISCNTRKQSPTAKSPFQTLVKFSGISAKSQQPLVPRCLIDWRKTDNKCLQQGNLTGLLTAAAKRWHTGTIGTWTGYSQTINDSPQPFGSQYNDRVPARKSCFSWRRSGGLAGSSVEFPPEQEEEVKHVSRINGVCRRRHGKTTLWHINPWCLCAVWTNLTQPNGLWVERGSATFSGVQAANKCATGGRRLQHTQLSTWLAKKKKR